MRIITAGLLLGTLVTEPLAVLSLGTSAAGTASLPASVPNNRQLIGVSFLTQFAVLDPNNALSLVFSNGGEGKVGG